MLNLIYHELNQLIDDYYRCMCRSTKEEILIDIKLLTAIVCENGDLSDFYKVLSKRSKEAH